MLARRVSAQPPILELHESTIVPLGSDVEVAEAASLRVADRVAASHNARVAWGVAQSRLFSESLVLLKVSRNYVRHKNPASVADE